MSINGKPLLIAGAIGKASGTIASFPDGNGANVRDLTISINPVQDLHGYDNPWPAGGGKNLLPPIVETERYGVTFTQSGDYINIYGTATTNAFVHLFDGVLPAGAYTINGMAGAGNASWQIGVKIGSGSYSYGSTSAKTFLSDGSTNIIVTLFAYPAYGLFNNVKVQYQLEAGEFSTAWTPYSNICPISGWTAVDLFRESAYDPTATPYIPITIPTPPGTVYGGYIHVAEDGSAELIVTHQFRTYTTVRGVYPHASNNRFWSISLSSQSISINTTSQTTDNYSSNMFRCQTRIVPGNFYVTNNGTTLVLVPWSDQQTITTKEQADAWMAANPVEACIPLATPVTYQLSDIQVQTLLGQNTMWADTGPVEVEYIKRSLMYMS